jgi:hypothetical protein
MDKFIILYNGTPTPVEAKTKNQVEKSIRQAWEQNQNSEADGFRISGISIRFQDYCNGKVIVLTVDEWFKLSKV